MCWKKRQKLPCIKDSQPYLTNTDLLKIRYAKVKNINVKDVRLLITKEHRLIRLSIIYMLLLTRRIKMVQMLLF